MIFKIKLLTYSRLLSIIAFIIFSFNISVVLADKFDLGPFKGKLSGKVALFLEIKEKNKYAIAIFDLDNQYFKIYKPINNLPYLISLSDIELAPDKRSIYGTGIFLKTKNSNDAYFKTVIMNLRELKLKVLKSSFPMNLNFRVSHNYENAIYNHNTKNDLEKLQISIFSFKDKSYTKIPCNSKQCLSPNWNSDDSKIIFSSNEERTITEFNLRTNKYHDVYISSNNTFVGSPSYTKNNNIIFTVIDKSENHISSNIYKFNQKEKTLSIIYKINEFVPSVVSLNSEDIVLFPINDIEQNKFLILDIKNNIKHSVYIPKPYVLDTPSWRL